MLRKRAMGLRRIWTGCQDHRDFVSKRVSDRTSPADYLIHGTGTTCPEPCRMSIMPRLIANVTSIAMGIAVTVLAIATSCTVAGKEGD